MLQRIVREISGVGGLAIRVTVVYVKRNWFVYLNFGAAAQRSGGMSRIFRYAFIRHRSGMGETGLTLYRNQKECASFFILPDGNASIDRKVILIDAGRIAL